MKKVGLDNNFFYTDVEYDADGWVDAKRFMPADFDLCLLKIEDKSSIPGWASGFNWDGLRVKKKDKVLYWKKI